VSARLRVRHARDDRARRERARGRAPAHRVGGRRGCAGAARRCGLAVVSARVGAAAGADAVGARAPAARLGCDLGQPPELLSVTDAELELSFYEKFLFGKGIEPYPVQEQAITHIYAGKSVLVTVPTGTGKTLMAKAALHKALGR